MNRGVTHLPWCAGGSGSDEFPRLARSELVTLRPRKEPTMAMQTFINLPVKNLAKATEFFTAIGFSFDPTFTDENATRMIISDETSVMLAIEPFFEGFIEPQAIADTVLAMVGVLAEDDRREQQAT